MRKNGKKGDDFTANGGIGSRVPPPQKNKLTHRQWLPPLHHSSSLVMAGRGDALLARGFIPNSNDSK